MILIFEGVTYCGDSSASNLTMANVPWHEEVVSFVQALCQRLPQYDLACEHEHSNCLLLANTKVHRLFSAEAIFEEKNIVVLVPR